MWTTLKTFPKLCANVFDCLLPVCRFTTRLNISHRFSVWLLGHDNKLLYDNKPLTYLNVSYNSAWIISFISCLFLAKLFLEKNKLGVRAAGSLWFSLHTFHGGCGPMETSWTKLFIKMTECWSNILAKTEAISLVVTESSRKTKTMLGKDHTLVRR